VANSPYQRIVRARVSGDRVCSAKIALRKSNSYILVSSVGVRGMDGGFTFVSSFFLIFALFLFFEFF